MIIQSEAIKAYRKLDEMKNTKFPANISFAIYKMKKQLKEMYDWQSGEETAIFQEYGGKFNEDGSIVIDDMSKAQEFADKLGALSKVEHPEFEKLQVPVAAFGEISMEELESLEPVFEFVD